MSQQTDHTGITAQLRVAADASTTRVDAVLARAGWQTALRDLLVACSRNLLTPVHSLMFALFPTRRSSNSASLREPGDG